MDSFYDNIIRNQDKSKGKKEKGESLNQDKRHASASSALSHKTKVKSRQK